MCKPKLSSPAVRPGQIESWNRHTGARLARDPRRLKTFGSNFRTTARLFALPSRAVCIVFTLTTSSRSVRLASMPDCGPPLQEVGPSRAPQSEDILIASKNGYEIWVQATARKQTSVERRAMTEILPSV